MPTRKVVGSLDLDPTDDDSPEYKEFYRFAWENILAPGAKERTTETLRDKAELGKWPGDEQTEQRIQGAGSLRDLNAVTTERQATHQQVLKARAKEHELRAQDPSFLERAGQSVSEFFTPHGAVQPQPTPPVRQATPATVQPTVQPTVPSPAPPTSTPPSTAKHLTLNADDEEYFRQWHADVAKQTGTNPDPDAPGHKYDYRAWWKSGIPLDESLHGPSMFKDDDHPNRFILQNGDIYDTKYDRTIDPEQFDKIATDQQREWLSGNQTEEQPNATFDEQGALLLPDTVVRGERMPKPGAPPLVFTDKAGNVTRTVPQSDPTLTPSVEQPGFLSGVKSGAISGTYSVGESAAGTVQRLTPEKMVADVADSFERAAQEYGPDAATAAKPWFERLTDPNYLGNLLGNTAIQTAPSLAAFMAGTVAGGPVVGGVAMAGTIYLQTAGETYREALKKYLAQGLPQDEAEVKAYHASGLAGFVSGVVNSLAIPASMIEPFTSKVTNLVLQWALNVGVDTADSLTQNLVAKASFDPQRDVTEGLPETVVASGLMSSGETMGAVKSVMTGPAQARDRMATPDEAVAPPARTSSAVANSPFAEPPEPKPQRTTPPRLPDVDLSGIPPELQIQQSRPPFLLKQQPSPAAPELPPAMVPTTPEPAPVTVPSEGGRPLAPETPLPPGLAPGMEQPSIAPDSQAMTPEAVVPGAALMQPEPSRQVEKPEVSRPLPQEDLIVKPIFGGPETVIPREPPPQAAQDETALDTQASLQDSQATVDEFEDQKRQEVLEDTAQKVKKIEQAQTPDELLHPLNALKPEFTNPQTPEAVIDQAAHEAATSPQNRLPEPSQAQKEAGNYQKGHVRVAGLDISIENPQGSTRSGTDPNGKPWSVTMQSHYGYIKGTVGKDKDHIDVFLKPGTPEDYSGTVYVVDQNNPKTGRFDEHKVILGASSIEEAKQLYRENYAKDWKGMGGIRAFPMQGFKEWLKNPDATKQPASAYNIPREKVPPTPEYTVTTAEIVPTRRPDGGVQYVAKNVREEKVPATPEQAAKPKEAPIAVPTPNGQDVIQSLQDQRKAFEQAEDIHDKETALMKAQFIVQDFLEAVEKSGRVPAGRIQDYRDRFNAITGKMEQVLRQLRSEQEQPATPEAVATTPQKGATITPPTQEEAIHERPQQPRLADSRPPEAASPENVPVVEERGTPESVRPRPATERGQTTDLPRAPRPVSTRSDGDTARSDLPAERGGRAESRRDDTAVSGPEPTTGQDFILGEDYAIPTGQKGKYKANVDAIKLLKQIESEGRLATPSEQATLAKYTGWGGLPQAFQWSHQWQKEYSELSDLLTEEEYAAARASTPNAYYTDPKTIRAIYRGLQHLGFKGGRVLEPGAGVGHFFGAMPVELSARSQRTAIEKDSISARIATQLYQHANVIENEYQKVTLPDNFFDVAVGNVPFADVKVFDPHNKDLSKLNLSLHDYYFAKALSQVRPGGVVAFITSRYTMDKVNGKLRDYVASKADLLGAIRLPNTQFKEIANTDVTTDILVLQRREDGTPAGGEPWAKAEKTTVGKEEVVINEYFIRHPEQIMGKLSTAGTMYRENEVTVESDGRDMAHALDEAFTRLPEKVIRPRERPKSTTQRGLLEALQASDDVKDGGYTIQNNALYVRRGAQFIPVPNTTPTDLERAKGLIGIREQVREVFKTQLGDVGELAMQGARDELSRRYDRFVKKFGPVNARVNKSVFREDPDYATLQALEKKYDPKTNKAQKADIFTKRVIEYRPRAQKADTAKEAMLVSMNESGRLDWDRMEELSGKSPEEMQQELKGLIYKDPSGDWQPADSYLSGNIRAKLKAAEAAAKIDARYQENVEALRAVIPADLKPAQIDVKLGHGWIPTEIYQKFIGHLFDVGRVKVNYNAHVGAYAIQAKIGQGNTKNDTIYGTKRYSGIELLQDALASKLPTVYDVTSDDKRVVNQKETLAAREKLQKIQDEFKEWLWSDDTRAKTLARLYNDEYNNVRLQKHDGSHLTLPGVNPAITLRPHQKNAIWRALQDGNTLLAHVVGAGKTYTMVGIAMEARRLRMANKPMIVVPNHLVEQWRDSILQLYPAANVLTPAKEDFQAANRKRLVGRIATGDWDAVVVAHSQLAKIPVSVETFEQFVKEQVGILEEYLLELKADKQGNRNIIKEIEKSKERLEGKLERRKAEIAERADANVSFEESGVDMLLVDEADLFKNLWFPTRMTRVAGLPNTESQRAYDLFLKTQYLNKLTNNRSVIFATGTPVSNSMAEVFTMQRYLQPHSLEAAGLQHFDSWARQYGNTVTSMELAPDGSGYRPRTRFAEFVNVPELTQMFRQVMDVQSQDDLQLPVPKLRGGKPINVTAKPSEALKVYTASLIERAKRLKQGAVDPRVDNMLKITGDGRNAALDVRLRVPGAPEDKNGKVVMMVNNVVEEYTRTKDVKGTQLVFLDLSTPKGDGKAKKAKAVEEDAGPPSEVELAEETALRGSVYQDIKRKLIKKGIPEREIAFIHDADTDVKKSKLFADVNAGTIRVLIGSTEKMGAGTNVQERLVALHNLDAPWRPRDLEQRNGRGIRQGNLLYENDPEGFELAVFNYATEAPSFDVYMWQTLEVKAKTITQIMKGDPNVRTIQDVDSAVLSYQEMKAIASGNPMILERVKAETELTKLQMLKSQAQSENSKIRYELSTIPSQISVADQSIEFIKKDQAIRDAHPADPLAITIDETKYDEADAAGKAIMGFVKEAAATKKTAPVDMMLGKYRGFNVRLQVFISNDAELILERTGSPEKYRTSTFDVSNSPGGLIERLDNAFSRMDDRLTLLQDKIKKLQGREVSLSHELNKPFEHDEKIKTLQARMAEIDKALDLTNKDENILGGKGEEPSTKPNEEEEGGDEAVSMMRVGGEGGEQRAAAGMDPRIMKVLGGNLYSGDLGKIAVKEMLQNAVDSIRALPEGRTGQVDVDVDTNKRTIVVSDTGAGMSPEVATKELLDIGGSKKVEGSSGGFGIAKVAIFANAETIDVSTRHTDEEGRTIETKLTGSGDDWMNPERGLKVETRPTSLVSGTTIKITLNQDVTMGEWAVRNWLKTFQNINRLPMEVSVKLDGRDITQRSGPLLRLHDKRFEFEGGWINVYTSDNTDLTMSPEVEILNHGLPQFSTRVWLGGGQLPMPSTIVADIRSEAGPEAQHYPFTPDRERLRKKAQEAVDTVVKELANEAAANEKQQFADAISKAPVIPGTPYKVFDTGELYADEQVKQFAQQPYVRQFAQAIGKALNKIQAVLARNNPEMQKVEFSGVGLGAEYLGVNIQGKVVAPEHKNLILINPFTILEETQREITVMNLDADHGPDDFSERLVATIVHELSHQGERGHGENFAGALTRNQGKAIMVSAEAFTEIRQALTAVAKQDSTGLLSFLTGGTADASPYDALTRDLADFKKAWKRGTDIFGKVSSSYAGDRRRESRQRDSERGQREGTGPQESVRPRGEGEARTLASGADISRAEPRDVTVPRYRTQAQDYRAQRLAEERGFIASDPDVDTRVRAAKRGLQPASLNQKLKEHAERVWHLVSREYENLPDTAQFSPLRTDLLRLQKYKGIAADQVQRDLAAIIKPLSRKQYDQFEWKALLSDLKREAEGDRALPFGYTPEKVQDDLDRLNELIAHDPMVQQAWEKRQRLWERLKQNYQRSMDAIGFDTSKKLTKDDYFRHQVMDYARERHLKGTGSRVRTPTGRGFLKSRHGSTMDINANYVQAEFEVMAQMVYDTQVAKVIKGVDEHYNIRRQLQQEAKTQNNEALESIIEAGGLPGALVEAALKDFRKRIGMHMSQIRKALDLQRGDRLTLEQIAEMAEDLESPANLAARGVFKAISERKAYIKETLGRQFVTWDMLIPDTHELWQPREGNVFYMADSIPAQLAKALQEGMLEEAGLTAEKLRKVLAMGNPREQYVIPKEAAATLNDLSHHEHSWFVDMNRQLLGHWKQLMLIAPRRVLRYNFRNLTGDADAAFVGNPSAFKKLPDAAKDLVPVIFKDTVLSGEAKEWAQRGGYGTTLQMQELGELNDLEAFKATLEKESKGGWLKAPATAWNKYWQTARLSTDYREALLRYAAYLDYLEQMRENPTGRPQNFGASIPETVMALQDVRDRAFKLSNELLGAYDRVSVAGQTIRSFWIPFWSWQEVNATRYYRLMRNAFDGEDAGTMARGAAIGTKKAAAFLVKMAFFWSALQVWNLLMFGDDEDELREANPTVANRPHILFGRDANGKIRYLTGIGALGDLLAWFGLDAFPGMVGDVMHGRLTIGEAVKNSAKAPVNKLWQGITPLVKLPLEVAVRESTYPDVFNPRPIQDRGDYLAQQTTLGPEVAALRGKPGKPLYGAEDLTGLLVQRTDPKAAAYSTWQGIEKKYLERMGKDSPAIFWRSPKGEALANWSRAIADQDTQAELHWKGEYERMEREKYGQKFSQTKMMDDIERSLRAKAPLAGVTKAERDTILTGLDAQEKRTLQRAEAYYRDTLLQVLPPPRRRHFEGKLQRQHWLTRPTPPAPGLTPELLP